jgi:hypothetical protein
MRRRFWVLASMVAALTVGLGGGAAYGFFVSAGAGSGTATVGTTAPVTVLEATGTITNELYPGTTGDLLVTLDNPNTYPVAITAIAGNGTVTGAGGVGSCTTTGVSVPSQSGLNISVASGSSVSAVIPGAASMGAASDTGCQGATFQVPVTLTVHKG